MGCVSCAGIVEEFSDLKGGITLHLKEPTTIPIEAYSITPDLLLQQDCSGIKKLPVFYGRRKVTIGDLFSVEGERSDRIIVQGALGHVKKIGQGMSCGRIEVQGDIGPHLGACMRGGEIIVKGNAGDWAGANMEGGRIWINGNAGHHVGAAYPGDIKGVNRGVIIIEGNAGSETGVAMRRGLIAVLGNTGDFTGAGMIAGSVLVFGHLGKRAGAGMKRGSIVAFGTYEPLLPIYRFESIFQPVHIRVLIKYLRELGLPVESKIEEGLFRRYSGDMNSLGKGEILIHD